MVLEEKCIFCSSPSAVGKMCAKCEKELEERVK